VVSFTPWPLYPQVENSRYTLDRRLGGLQSRSRRGGEEKKFQPLPRLEPPTIQPVIYPILLFLKQQRIKLKKNVLFSPKTLV
jgi:hypothetical protein